MNAIRSIYCLFLAIVFLAGGCGTPKLGPNPLEKGWKLSQSQDPSKLDKAIRDDYQDYIERLPDEERKFVGSIHLFEDGTGQNAVKIQINLWGTRWDHVLVYDGDKKRIKTLKYKAGRYRS